MYQNNLEDVSKIHFNQLNPNCMSLVEVYVHDNNIEDKEVVDLVYSQQGV